LKDLFFLTFFAGLYVAYTSSQSSDNAGIAIGILAMLFSALALSSGD
jgi:hypothetical protein